MTPPPVSAATQAFRPQTGGGVALVVLFILSVALARAQEPGPVVLTWQEAVQEALRRSPELAKIRLEVSAAELDEPFLLAELDPELQARYLWTDDQSPRSVPVFQGTRSRRENVDVSLVQKTLLGTEARLTWQSERLRNPAQFRPLDPTVESRLSLDVRQPLLRYFWGRPDKARRRLFRSGTEAVRHRLRFEEGLTAMSVSRAYARLYTAERNVELSRSAVDTARELDRSYREKKRYGMVDPSDLFQAQVSLKIQDTDLIMARAEQQNALTALMAELQRHSEGDVRPLVAAAPPDLSVDFQDEESAVHVALQNRPDVWAARSALEAAEWGMRVEILDTLPDLAFLGSYGIAGLDTDYSGAQRDLRGRDHSVKSAGISLTVPFGSKKEKLNRRSGRYRLQMAQRDVELATQRSLADTRRAWVGWETARMRLDAARRLADLERQKLAAEEKDFSRGRSTTDLVVRFRQDLFRARRRLVQAEVDAFLAGVDLKRATGTLLDGF